MTILNNGGEFEGSFKEIYLPELELKMKNALNTDSSCLAVGIKIRDNMLSISLYDKQDESAFFIVRRPYIPWR